MGTPQESSGELQPTLSKSHSALLMASTNKLLSSTPSRGVREEMSQLPRTLYDCTKAASETNEWLRYLRDARGDEVTEGVEGKRRRRFSLCSSLPKKELNWALTLPKPLYAHGRRRRAFTREPRGRGSCTDWP